MKMLSSRSLLAFTLIISICVTLTGNALAISFAPIEQKIDAVTCSETFTDNQGITVTMEQLSHTAAGIAALPTNIARRSYTSSAVAFNVYHNGQFNHSLIVDMQRNLVTFAYPDDTIDYIPLNEIVVITTKNLMLDDNILPIFNNLPTINAAVTDWVLDERPSVSSSGAQDTLTGASVYSGYSAMGYRSYYGETGYLLRKNSGSTYGGWAKDFTFSKGTSISTAAGIIIAAATAGNVVGLVIGVATTILGAIVSSVIDSYSVSFEVRIFRWDYQIKRNSNTGTVIGTNYRTQDYFKGYNSGTGAVYYKYRGSAYDEGFAFANDLMIQNAISKYLGG